MLAWYGALGNHVSMALEVYAINHDGRYQEWLSEQ
jgi:hypothetical protein